MTFSDNDLLITNNSSVKAVVVFTVLLLLYLYLCYMLSGYYLVLHSCLFLQYYSIFHSVFIMCLGYAWLSSLSKKKRIILWIISVGTNFIETTISMSGVFFQYHYIYYTQFY